MSDDWRFRCENCGKEWENPPAPVSGHFCEWSGRGMPPASATEYNVVLVEKPDTLCGDAA